MRSKTKTFFLPLFAHYSAGGGGIGGGGGAIMPHIKMQDNFFYVDKDILEARARGEADLLEVPHTCLTIGREIGKGAFGRVYIARADNIGGKPGSQVVAVKQLKSIVRNFYVPSD